MLAAFFISSDCAPRFASGLHRWKSKPRDSFAGRAHGAGDGAAAAYHHKQTLFTIFHGDLPDMNQSMYGGLAAGRALNRLVKAGWYRPVCLGVNLWALWCVLHKGHSNS
jgi:hypothetical protein